MNENISQYATAQIVRKYRSEREMSLRQFADELCKGSIVGISHQTIANWEDGAKPNIATIYHLLQFKDWRASFARELIAMINMGVTK